MGELMVATRLLEEDYDVFFPFVDDVSGIDLVSYKDGVFDSLQVRYHKVKQGKSSLTFNVNPCQADTIALPIGNKICFVPNKRKGERWHINLPISPPRNNQKKFINSYVDYLEYKPRGKNETN